MDISVATTALAALAHPTRLVCFRLLAEHAPSGLPAGEAARLMGVPQNTLSTHLAILARAGLVSSTRSGRSIVYRAGVEALHDLTDYLLNRCCGGRPDLCLRGAKPVSLPTTELAE